MDHKELSIYGKFEYEKLLVMERLIEQLKITDHETLTDIVETSFCDTEKTLGCLIAVKDFEVWGLTQFDRVQKLRSKLVLEIDQKYMDILNDMFHDFYQFSSRRFPDKPNPPSSK